MSLVIDKPVQVMLSIYEALLSEPGERRALQAFGFTPDTFLRTCAGATVVGFQVGGELGGGMFFMKNRVHLGVLRRHRRVWCRYFRQMLELGFKAHGTPLIALVAEDNLAAQRFTERVGGVRIGETVGYLMYQVDKEKINYPNGSRSRILH